MSSNKNVEYYPRPEDWDKIPHKRVVINDDNTPPLTDEEIDKLNELKPEDWE